MYLFIFQNLKKYEVAFYFLHIFIIDPKRIGFYMYLTFSRIMFYMFQKRQDFKIT